MRFMRICMFMVLMIDMSDIDNRQCHWNSSGNSVTELVYCKSQCEGQKQMNTLNEGTWVYTSDGSQLEFDAPWYQGWRTDPSFGLEGPSRNCILYCSMGKWCDYSCTGTWNSICEME